MLATGMGDADSIHRLEVKGLGNYSEKLYIQILDFLANFLLLE
jgi:hypothetical protein